MSKLVRRKDCNNSFSYIDKSKKI